MAGTVSFPQVSDMPANKINDESNDSLLHTISNKAGPLFPASTKAIVTPLTQPILVTLRQQQASVRQSQPLSFFSASKKMITQNPKNLWRGTLPSASKEFFKYSFYKVFIIQNTQSYVNKIADWNTLPNHFAHPLKSMVAGSIAGTADVIFGGALERYATYVATAQGPTSSACFSTELKSQHGAMNKVQFLYRGAASSIAKSSIGFSLMFGTKEPIKQSVNTALNMETKTTPKWCATFCSAMMSGGLIALTTAPLDIIKTLKQMPGGRKQGALSLLHNNFVKHGIRGLTAGLPAKFCLISLGWALNFMISELAVQTDQAHEVSSGLKLR